MLKHLKISFFIFSFLIGNGTFSQELLPEFYDTTKVAREIKISGNAFELSSSIYNDFTRKFLFGGELNDEIKEKAYNRQRTDNRIGGAYHFAIEYRSTQTLFKDNPEWSWMANASLEAHFSGEYTKDLFGLAFLGNEPFLGKEANFGATSARIEQFLSIGGGIHHKKNKSFITLNAILPQSFFEAKIQHGNLTFNESGDQISLTLQGETIRANDYTQFKGIGLALNFDINIPFGNPYSLNGVVRIAARNIGMYQVYNARQNTFQADEKYSGFSVEQLLEENFTSSILDTLGVENNTESRLKLLPGLVQVGKIVTQNTDKKIQSFFGVRIYANRIYFPMVYAGVHYQIKPRFSMGTQGTFGGYGSFRWGLYLNYNTEKINVGLGTEDLLGMVLKNSFGHSGIIRLAWKF